MDAFTREYMKAAALTEDPQPPQGEYPEPAADEYDPLFVKDAARDCAAFQERAGELIADDLEHAARDFWYTRNGHGCGFWDGDWPEPAASELTKIAKSFGEYSDIVLQAQYGSEE